MWAKMPLFEKFFDEDTSAPLVTIEEQYYLMYTVPAAIAAIVTL